ncbi:hypothetical protein ACO2Q2_10745 [Dyella sp. KRB-257]|uniref:hypothetical protein n=1 Tax=Dyella sp. KRB-257 TaxID=3400915 RepID=UPI003BFBF8E5
MIDFHNTPNEAEKRLRAEIERLATQPIPDAELTMVKTLLLTAQLACVVPACRWSPRNC